MLSKLTLDKKEWKSKKTIQKEENRSEQDTTVIHQDRDTKQDIGVAESGKRNDNRSNH